MKDLVLYSLFIVIAIAILAGTTCTFRLASCHIKASKQELECSYNPLQGCMVKIDGKWIDYSSLRLIEQ